MKKHSKKILILLCAMLLSSFCLVACGGSSSSNGISDEQIEKTKNELYYKGSNGKYYLK